MIDDLLKLISEYLDLRSFQLLISDNSKIFTEEKYKKLQNEYDTYFYNCISEMNGINYLGFSQYLQRLNIENRHKKYFCLK